MQRKIIFFCLLVVLQRLPAIANESKLAIVPSPENAANILFDAIDAVELNRDERAATLEKYVKNNSHPELHFELARFYQRGFVVDSNEASELLHLRSAAVSGHAIAAYHLWQHYILKKPKNTTEAIVWLKMSAKNGLPEAQGVLAGRYEKGDGVIQNFKKSAAWYELAAYSDLPYAQCAIARHYFGGLGVARDSSRAYAWSSVAYTRSEGRICASERMTYQKRIVNDSLPVAQELAEQLFLDSKKNN